MKRESPETQRRRLVEERERLEEYAKEDIIVENSVTVRQLRSTFRAEHEGTSVKSLQFHQRVELMEHCMYELEEEQVEAEEEERRVQESLGEVLPSYASPRTAHKNSLRDLTVLQDGEERKEKLVESTLEAKAINEPDTPTAAAAPPSPTRAAPPSPTATPAATPSATPTTALKSRKAQPDHSGHSTEDSAKSAHDNAHDKHEKLDRARMALINRTASGGTLLPNKMGHEEHETAHSEAKKGRAMVLAPRVRRQTQATDPGSPPTPTSRIVAVANAAIGLGAMKAAMEEKAKLYRPAGTPGKVVSKVEPDTPTASSDSSSSSSSSPSSPSNSSSSEPTATPASETTTTATNTTTNTTASAVSEAVQEASPPPTDSVAAAQTNNAATDSAVALPPPAAAAAPSADNNPPAAATDSSSSPSAENPSASSSADNNNSNNQNNTLESSTTVLGGDSAVVVA